MSIQSVAFGASGNRICGIGVGGNLGVSQSDGAGDRLPDARVWVPTFAGNVALTGNASVRLKGKKIDNTLFCSGNASIVGAYDSAAKKTGQCAAFLLRREDLLSASGPSPVLSVR